MQARWVGRLQSLKYLPGPLVGTDFGAPISPFLPTRYQKVGWVLNWQEICNVYLNVCGPCFLRSAWGSLFRARRTLLEDILLS